MNDKSIQTLEQAIVEQPKSFGTFKESKAVIPVTADSKISINCDNCNCCIFSFGSK